MASSVENRNNDPQHTWWYRFFMKVPVRCFILPIGKFFLYDIRTTKYKGEYRKPFLLVYNHACDYDFIGVINGFPGYYRHIMSDSLIKKPWRRAVIKFGTNGIFRRKGENAAAVMEAVKHTIDQGISVCMAPEGEETPNGVTQRIRRKSGIMIKDLNVDLITYKLEGGYLFKPKWASHRSKGPMYGHVVNIYKKEDLAKMTPEEINEILQRDLDFNVYEWNREKRIKYDRKCRAEHMERSLHICPKCEAMNRLHSEGHGLYCLECGYSVTVDEYGFFQGDDVRFDNFYDWDMWQKEYLRSMRPQWEAEPEKIITSNSGCTLKKRVGDNEEVIDENVTISINFTDIMIKGDKVDFRFPLLELEGLTSTTLAATISHDGDYYKVVANEETCMARYRTIRRIIMEQEFL